MRVPTPLEWVIYDIMRGNPGFCTSGGPGRLCKCCGRFTGEHESDITIHHTKTCLLGPIVPHFVVGDWDEETDFNYD